jgi:hypothetical protein
MGRTLLEQGDGIDNPGFTLPGTGSLAITFDDTGTSGLTLDFLVLSGTPSVSIASTGASPHTGFNRLNQLIETDHSLTTVTISGSEPFILGSSTGDSNTGDGVVTDILVMPKSSTTIHSSLTLIDASAATGDLEISAGATNISSGRLNFTITYTGLVIKGGSGSNFIENDAKNGLVRDGNANSDTTVLLGGAGAKAFLGPGFNDNVFVGASDLGTIETAGSALGDKVTFGAGATAVLTIGMGAEAGSTAGTTSIGLTKVSGAADGMIIHFNAITSSRSVIVDETAAVASATNLSAAENAAVKAMNSPGVAYFDFGYNEYFIATNNIETTVSPNDAIVKLVGVTDIHHATNSLGVVTLHV